MNRIQRGKASGAAGHEADFQALCEAILQLRTRDECRKFLLDLCTPAEILAFAERWKLARLLDKNGLSYRELHEKTGISVTTIGRVARFLNQESYQGYRLVLQRLKGRKKE
jgi:TrpR-related protein YerC/YecD